MAWVATGTPIEALEDGHARVVDVSDTKLLLIRLGDEVRATSAWCTHARTLLGDQPVDADGLIECPMHGAVFDTADGALQVGPSCAALPVFEVEIDQRGEIVVALPDGAPAAPPARPSSFGAWGAPRR